MSTPVVIAGMLWAWAFFSMLLGSVLSLIFYRRRTAIAVPSCGWQPVSILKPCKGYDDKLEDNLTSFFALDYPEYELIFSVADVGDVARSVIERLIARFPHVRATLIVGDVDVGANPKVNNMIRSSDAAAHDWLLISDSNIRVEPNYIKRMMSCVDDCTGIVTSPVLGVHPKHLGGELERVYLNTFYARWLSIAKMMRHPIVMGKSMMFRRTQAARFGGLRALAAYFAEDYVSGQQMKKLGLQVRLTPTPVHQYIGEYSFASFWARHVRWGRIRKYQAPWAFYGFETWMAAVFSGFLGAPFLSVMCGMPMSLAFVLHLAMYCSCDMLIMRSLGDTPNLKAVWAWLLREWLAFPLWLHIALGNTVIWRGKKFRVLRGGRLVPLQAHQESSTE